METRPWPHLLVDGFLPDSVFDACFAEIAQDDYEFGIEDRGTGRIEFSLLRSKTLWRAIYSRRTVELLAEAFGAEVTLNKHNMLQLRRMNEQTPDFPLHHDATDDGESIASFLYLSPGWSSECGGQLHLFESNKQAVPEVSIAPVRNRFVAFRTKPSHWHAVGRVYGWERLSVLALWNVK